LPCENLSPVRCPRCHKINREGLEQCEACQYDLPESWVVGSPQEEATSAARNRPVVAVLTIIEKVKGAYGLGEAPIQTALGFSDHQLNEEIVRAKSIWEKKLEGIGRLDTWAVENTEQLCQLTGDQLRTVQAQAQALETVGRRIGAAVAQEVARRS